MKLKICLPAFDFVQKKDFREAHKEKYLYFLSLLSREKKYRNLNAQHLKSALGKNKGFNYKSIITNLTNEGVIECDGIRIYGKKSLGYKLTDKYYSSEKIEYLLINKRFTNQIQIAAIKNFKILPEYVKQQTQNLSELTINGKYVKLRLARRSRSGRISNYLTTNKKELRDYLLYRNEEKLIEFDFNGFQPYLLGLIVSRGLGYKSFDEDMPDDLRLYLQLAEQGIVYEFFYDLTGRGNEAEFKRDDFKKQFYKTYFFNTKFNVVNKSEVGKIFKTQFPTIHNYIILNFINKSKTLANALQVEESRLVINTIYKRLYEEGIWSATINDSVVCLIRNKEQVYQIVESIINQNIVPCFINENKWKGIDIYPEERIDKDYISKEGEKRIYNKVTFDKVCTHLTEDCRPVNKNDELKNRTRNILLKAIDKLKAENKAVSVYQLNKITNINKATVRKHLSAINQVEQACAGSPTGLPIPDSANIFEEGLKPHPVSSK